MLPRCSAAGLEYLLLNTLGLRFAEIAKKKDSSLLFYSGGAIFLSMKLSSNTRYAVRILLELWDAKTPVSIAPLSDKTGIALRTIENVHTVLKLHGVTDATVGAKGGIRLERSLDEVSLGQLVEWFDEGIEISVCCGGKANECPRQISCQTRAVWHDVTERLRATLDAISIGEIFRNYPKTDAIL